ncbi:multiple inositol polyphosphate phosphatase 1-like isoform X2 [Lycorma delicatula]|uniref:multiple inositol polyphosphate phosphatase 1-like isoform X2 n=1 Tax=Lycorma delicatula TaxID=130591 RepID=UPI003F514857
MSSSVTLLLNTTIIILQFSAGWLHHHHHHHHHYHNFWHNFDTFCYADIQDPYLLFSSKTSYNAVYYKNYVNIIPDECTPRQIWMLTRHGSRYATKKKMEEFHKLTKLRNLIIHNHAQNRGYLCKKDLENLRQWSFEEPLSKSDKLTSEGYNDLWEMGHRIRAKFPELFKTSENETMYKFQIQHTDHSKTKASAQAFVTGLFKKKIHIPVPTSDDLLTRLYPNCRVLPLPDADDPPDEGKNERTLFREGPIVNEVVRNVSIRLGFVKSLAMDEVENMYDMCRYKKAWKFEELSPWCACFLKSELQVLEYMPDLTYYYNSGHGYSGNLRTGCLLVQDMMNRFSDIAKNEETSKEPNGVFYFGHSTTLYNLFARLGVAKDSEHITHENYYNMTNRKWHTSLLAPFSANFAAVFLNVLLDIFRLDKRIFMKFYTMTSELK